MNSTNERKPRSRAPDDARSVLVSIHARYAELILGGHKSVELRRRFDVSAAGSTLIIYATLPTAAVVGSAVVGAVERLPLRELWDRHGPRTAVSAGDFARYFDGTEEGCALLLSRPTRYERPIPLAELRTRHGINAPQSYVYLGDAHRDLVRHEQD